MLILLIQRGGRGTRGLPFDDLEEDGGRIGLGIENAEVRSGVRNENEGREGEEERGGTSDNTDEYQREVGEFERRERGHRCGIGAAHLTLVRF